MIKNTKILIFAGLLVGASACTDLKEELKTEITSDISIPGIARGVGADASTPPPDALDGAYGQLRDAGTANHGGYYSVQEITSDEQCIGAKGGDWFDGGILIELHKHTYTPTHAFLNGTWGATYTAINACNELLAKTTLSDNEKAQMKALRAYFYMRMCDLFGNVKIVTAPGQDPPQATRAQVFDFIEKELLEAIGVPAITAGLSFANSPLPASSSVYRINRWGALGILSKLYLNAEVYKGVKMYDKAALAAGYVIDLSGAQLCSTGCKVANMARRPAVTTDTPELEGYAAVFAPNNGGNQEHIFSVYYDAVKGGGMNFCQMNLHYSSQFTYNFNEQPWNGYATLEEFYNSYDNADMRKKASFLAGPQTDFTGGAVLDYAADDGGLQLDYTPRINSLGPNSLREAGARAAKFSFQQFGLSNMDNDYPIIRLGEMYLVRAEALARNANDWSRALPDANIIRARAGMPAYTSLTADEFLKERGREMFQEAARRTDLIRFGKYNDTWWEKPVSNASKNIFPIPFDQIQASKGTLKQNPGY